MHSCVFECMPKVHIQCSTGYIKKICIQLHHNETEENPGFKETYKSFQERKKNNNP